MDNITLQGSKYSQIHIDGNAVVGKHARPQTIKTVNGPCQACPAIDVTVLLVHLTDAHAPFFGEVSFPIQVDQFTGIVRNSRL